MLGTVGNMTVSTISHSDAGGKMRIFLTQSAYGLHASSGGYRANLAFCRAMVAAGHTVLMLALPYRKDLKLLKDVVHVGSRPFGTSISTGDTAEQQRKQHHIDVFKFNYLELEVVGLEAEQYADVFDSKETEDVERYSTWLEGGNDDDHGEANSGDVDDEKCIYQARQKFVYELIEEFQPTHLVMNERGSLKIAMDKRMPLPQCVRVFVAHDVNNLPFGPYAVAGETKAQHQRLKDVDALWAVSKAVQAYFTHFGGITHGKALHNHPVIYADNPEDLTFYDNFDKTYVTFINPGPLKGFQIAHSIIRLMPDIEFLVVKSWSMVDHVVEEYEALPNATVVPSTKRIDDLFAQTKLLVVPSVCYEAFGLVVVEALLRGIPVVSSDAGGLPEAHLGVPWVVPVTPMSGEKETDVEVMSRLGEWKIPFNDPDPWLHIIHAALHDHELYERVRVQGRETALEYLRSLDTGIYERWLLELARRKIYGPGENGSKGRVNGVADGEAAGAAGR
ncbi:uncharacterized protein EV422DRAFT_119599 [Fimicolochytrium jonesii]|uniref:uncharacterized protein n=1 Tax=Fimicolochytrium jonesii TaxID=1396493 RepID=UPI0022FE4BFC|nr:uncharacterized protein EV422DRAFT_119599 [Fimicolochytrium jonesii]KAI8819152.1 hypothetical protein EV422DRAFT_119599 [Fimicolochytrium jonesii]